MVPPLAEIPDPPLDAEELVIADNAVVVVIAGLVIAVDDVVGALAVR
jgi:hypothetical protein